MKVFVSDKHFPIEIMFKNVFFSLLILFSMSCALEKSLVDRGREQLVDLKLVVPSVVLDVRYFSNYNFVGKRIDGYKSPKCLLTLQAALALKKVQVELKKKSIGLKVYDCFRPQKAVDHFVRWANDLHDTKMKSIFYPDVKKSDLFEKGYIAKKSGHTRGSTLDLTLTHLPEKETVIDKSHKTPEIDMGTPYDFFGERSHTINNLISEKQQNNRLVLKTVMEKYGFKNYEKEWWHYTLKGEPFPDSYFDFDVK